MSTMNFENILQEINRFVTIKEDDRQVYTRDFDNVKNRIFKEMKNVDPAFKSIASSPVLGGSYADGLKVSKPNEFDLVLQLEFPDHQLIEVEGVPQLPGYVTIRVSALLQKIKKEDHNSALHNKLQQLVNEYGFLMQAKFLRWVQSIVDTVLNQFPDGMISIDGELYKIRSRSTHGPAQTLDIEVGSRRFSIDFVPALRLPTFRWPAMTPCPMLGKDKPWITIPKPVRDNAIGYDANNLYWITSFVDQERYLIEKRNFLKPSIRLLKKLRDKYNVINLKSYYIKTVFLWIVAEKEREGDHDFGREGLGTTFLYGFERLLKFFEEQSLPFFWYKNFNMLDKLSEEQRLNMYYQFKAVHKKIQNFKDTDPAKLRGIFLTEPQIESFENGNASIVTEQREELKFTKRLRNCFLNDVALN